MFWICTRTGRTLFGPFTTWAGAARKLSEYPNLAPALNIEQRKPLQVVPKQH